MKIIPATFLTLLLPLLPAGGAMAEKEKQAAAANPTARSIERHNTDIEVKVKNDGELITVDVAFTVPVPPQQAWAVLTDFDNISSFNSSIRSSKVISRSGGSVHVSQSGIEKYGFLTISLESVRKIDLLPFRKIQERMVSGSMEKMEETTLLLPDGEHTRIIYHADIIPGSWIVRFVGAVSVENEARKQFQEIINEINRRKRLIVTSG